MDSLANLGTFFSSGGGAGLKDLAALGSAGAGLFGNISAERQRSQELNRLKQQEAAAEVSPTQLASQVTAATQPLDRALTETVGNQVSGTLAEQGLSQAPGIQAQALAQGLAPFQQQNQATALQLVLKRLGLPVEYAQTLLQNNPKGVDLSPLLALLGKQGGSTGGGMDIAALMKLLNLNNPNTATPYKDYSDTSGWAGNFPAPTQATPPADASLPSWLTSAPATAPTFVPPIDQAYDPYSLYGPAS